MTDKIIQEYSDELNRLGEELKSAFDTHVQPIIDEMFTLTEKIESEGGDDDHTIRQHLFALWKYAGIIEKLNHYMRNKAIVAALELFKKK